MSGIIITLTLSASIAAGYWTKVAASGFDPDTSREPVICEAP